MKTVLNTEINTDPTKQPLFLGRDLSLQRYDKFRYPELFELFDKQLQLFWRPEEIELTRDRADFQTLTDHERFIFTSNLKYQTMMDSVIARGIGTITQWTSNLEFEAAANVWQMFETIHSYAYTYIIKNVYAKPSDVFDSIIDDPEIMKRAASVSRDYDMLMHCDGDVKSQIYLTLISVNILEAIRFYVSFACSFAFAENKKMIGNADIIKLIQRDENCHLQITQTLLNKMRMHEDEGFKETIEKNRDKAVSMFVEAVEEEKAWAKHLFKDGAILGLNEVLLCGYIEYLARVRMNALGLDCPEEYATKNPLGWLRSWTNSDQVQVAPQETEITSYKKSSTVNDSGSLDFSGFDL